MDPLLTTAALQPGGVTSSMATDELVEAWLMGNARSWDRYSG